MTNLATVVRATRASAKAIARMQHYSILCRHARGADYKALRRAYDRAKADYERAQRALAANPLPGDSP